MIEELLVNKEFSVIWPRQNPFMRDKSAIPRGQVKRILSACVANLHSVVQKRHSAIRYPQDKLLSIR